jgi:hypothetical protein
MVRWTFHITLGSLPGDGHGVCLNLHMQHFLQSRRFAGYEEREICAHTRGQMNQNLLNKVWCATSSLW